MEIIHIILGKANPNRMNGINKVVYQLATKQALAGKNVRIWGVTKDLSHNYGERTFETELFKACKIPFMLNKELTKKVKSIKSNTIVHLHGGWVPLYFKLSMLLKKHKIPFILTAHGAYNTIAMKRSNLVKKFYYKLFERKVLDAAHKIHCIGESEVKGLKQLYSDKKAVLLPYGFEVAQNGIKAVPDTKEFIIGFVGRTDIYTKGLDLLLNAFDKFRVNNPDSRLWIIGSSKELGALKEGIAAHELEENVILWGSKFGTEKEELMKQMTVFAHPSRNEGLPASVLEAASMGIPSVVSKATNIGSFINKYNAGIVVDDEDIEGLTTAFYTLKTRYSTESLGEMGTNSQRMVSESFNWNTIINAFDVVYN